MTPTEEPAVTPTEEPVVTPTEEPVVTPTEEPAATPTAEPAATPTAEPTATPTAEPTATPTAEPTATPTAEPTATPTAEPVMVSYTVKYLDKATEEAIGEEVTGEAPVGEVIEIEAPEIEGYTLCADQPTELVLTEGAAAVTLAEGVENQQVDPNTVVVYYEAATPETAEQTLTAEAGNAKAAVTAVLPEGVTVQMNAMGDAIGDENMNALMEAVGVNVVGIEAYDISLVDSEGNAYTLPEGVSATVTLSGVALQPGEGELINAVHIKADGSVDNGVFAENGDVTFTVTSFSPFVVATVAAESGNKIATMKAIGEYAPGDSISVTTGYTYSSEVFGANKYRWLLDGDVVDSGSLSRSGKNYTLTTTLPQDIMEGSHEIVF